MASHADLTGQEGEHLWSEIVDINYVLLFGCNYLIESE